MRVVRGDRPPRPSLPNSNAMSDDMWLLTQSCWDHDATRRPSADTIAITLPRTKLETATKNYLNHLRFVVEDRVREIGKVCASVVLATSDLLTDLV